MIRIVGILMFLVLLTGCEKYVVEKSDVTLSGLYVVDAIDIIGNNGSTDTTLNQGQIFESSIAPEPFNHIETNDFNINFESDGLWGDFEMIWTNKNNPFVTPQWLYDSRKLTNFYDGFTIYGNNQLSLGTLQLNYTTADSVSHTMSFKIEKDGFESLQLLSTGSYPFGPNGTKSYFRLYMTRIHP
jgi:hypothetical protein